MTMVWAHRGASGYAPENTLPAIEMALEQGADAIEIDVQLTRDDEVVVIHDETLERTTSGNGWVADHSLEALRALDASAGDERYRGTRVPTLQEVLHLAGDATVNVELKNTRMRYHGLEERVLAIVAELGAADRVVVSSFNHYSLRHLLHLGTPLPLGALYSDPLFQPWKYARRLGATALHPPLRATRRKLIEACHDLGMPVHVWTVNEPDDIKKMAKVGADAVITNYPNLARSIIG